MPQSSSFHQFSLRSPSPCSRHFNADGNLPLPLIFALLALGAVSGEFAGRFMTPDVNGLTLHVAIAAETLGVTAIIYAIGWGPTLDDWLRVHPRPGARHGRVARLARHVRLDRGGHRARPGGHRPEHGADVRAVARCARSRGARHPRRGIRDAIARHEDRGERARPRGARPSRCRVAGDRLADVGHARVDGGRHRCGRPERPDDAQQRTVRRNVGAARRPARDRRPQAGARARVAATRPSRHVRGQDRRALRPARLGERRHARVPGRPRVRTPLASSAGGREDRRSRVELPRRHGAQPAPRPVVAPGVP